MIIEQARANQLYSLKKFLKQGFIPAHIYRDSIYFFSPIEDARLAIPGILDYEREQRGYHHEMTYRVSAQLLAAFNEQSAAKCHKMLNGARHG